MRVKVLAAAAFLLLASFSFGVAADPAAPTAARAAGPSAADLAFLAGLVESDPLPDLGIPAPQSLTCTATENCGDGNTVYCEGNSVCQVTSYGVKCDSNEVYCPNYCTVSQVCQCCSGTYYGFCSSKKGDCQDTEDGIACDGFEITCEMSCPLCPEW